MEDLQNVTWGQFKIGDLFEIEKSKSKLKKDKLSAYSPELYPVYSSDSGNHGVVGYIKENPSFKLENNEYMIVFGDHTRAINIAKKSFSICDNVKILSNSNNYSIEITLFIITAWKKAIPDLGYNRHWKKAREVNISLPTTPNGDPDYNFMEQFIKDLEQEHIQDLEKEKILEEANYMQATGLSDTKLTKAEQQALKDFESLTWGDFKLGDLFGKSKRGKRLKSRDRVDGTLPFVTAGDKNEGISGNIGNEVMIYSKNTITIDMFGSAKYRNYPYGADDHITIVDTSNLEKHSAIFITTSIHKTSHSGKFNYGLNFYPKDADSLIVKLPLDPTDPTKPDYNFMSTYIKAIEKLTIKDVVDLTDQKIQKTKQVI